MTLYLRLKKTRETRWIE